MAKKSGKKKGKKDGKKKSSPEDDAEKEKKKQEEMAAAMQANLSLIQIVWNHLVCKLTPEEKVIEQKYIDNCKQTGERITTTKTIKLEEFIQSFQQLVCLHC